MRIKISDIPDEIIEQYNLKSLVTPEGYVYCKINRGMYGLPQAGLIAQELLQKRLAEYGYNQSQIINGLWTHTSRPICFCLCVDDFAVKYVRQEDADHLISAIKKYYPITVDWKATKYIGLTIDWDYPRRKANIHMLGYLDKAFARFKHQNPTKIQRLLHPHVITKYGAKIQYATEDEASPPLSADDTKIVQAVAGTLLYYARAVDPTILTAPRASQTDRINDGESKTIVRLLCNARRSHHHIQCK